jgi:integrase
MRFKEVVEAMIASTAYDQGSLSRLAFWTETLGERPLAEITGDEIDAAIVRLAERGRLNGGVRPVTRRGRSLSPSTINRHLSQIGSVFVYAKRQRLLPRAFVSPTRGIERSPERADPDRYLRPQEFERLLAVARVLDQDWGKWPALLTVAYHTSLRVGSILRLKGKYLDLQAGTMAVIRQKNGDAITTSLSTAALEELKRLPKVGAEELVFGNAQGKVYAYRCYVARQKCMTNDSTNYHLLTEHRAKTYREAFPKEPKRP